MTDTGAGAVVVDRLDEVRSERGGRVAALVAGVIVGVLLGTVHWVGILLGGAVAGLGQRTPLLGVAAGALAGLGIWLVFLGTLQSDAAATAALASMPIIAVSFAVAVIYGAFGGLVRGIG